MKRTLAAQLAALPADRYLVGLLALCETYLLYGKRLSANE